MVKPHTPPVVKQIPVDRIRPGSQQTRRYFHPEALKELADSIRESGVVQPVVLRTRVWGYELLAGERRWRASQQAGLHEIPAVIRDDLSDTEAFVVGLIENLQRESLSPVETASGLKRLAEVFALTHEEVGGRIGKSREYVSNHLRLLNLLPEVQVMVNEGLIPLSHAKILAGLDPGQQRRLAVAVASSDGKLTVRMLERQVAKLRDSSIVFRPGKSGDWQVLERELSDHMGYPVQLKAAKNGRGELKVKFHSLDELDGILSRIGYRSR